MSANIKAESGKTIIGVDGGNELEILSDGTLRSQNGKFTNQETNDYIFVNPADDSFSFVSNSSKVFSISGSGNTEIAGKLKLADSTTAAALEVTQAGTGYALRINDQSGSDPSPFAVDNQGRLLVSTPSPKDAISLLGSGSLGAGITSSPFVATLSALSVDSGLYVKSVSGVPFYVEDASGNDSSPFIINKDGRVGIWTKAPASNVALHVNGHIQSNFNVIAKRFINAEANDFIEIDPVDDSISFHTNNIERMVIEDTTVTFNDNVEIDGTAKINAPNNFWSSQSYYDVANLGGLATQGSYEVNLTCNGYRNENDTWTTLSAYSNDNVGASQISLTPDGDIFISSDALKQNGSGIRPTVRMTVKNNGRVGIGTTAPTTTLDVNGNIAANIVSATLYTNRIGFNGETTVSGSAPNTDGVMMNYETALFGSAQDGLLIEKTDFNALTADGGILFANRNQDGITEPALAIRGNGRIGIGVTSPSYQLQLSTDSAAKPTSTTWTVASDERIKENIEVADIDRCYEIVKGLPLKRYSWKQEVVSNDVTKDRSKLGWIAQEVEKVFPKAVDTIKYEYDPVFERVEKEITDEEGNVTVKTETKMVSQKTIEDLKTLNADQIYAVMYGAIQKLMSVVEQQQEDIKALKASN